MPSLSSTSGAKSTKLLEESSRSRALEAERLKLTTQRESTLADFDNMLLAIVEESNNMVTPPDLQDWQTIVKALGACMRHARQIHLLNKELKKWDCYQQEPQS